MQPHQPVEVPAWVHQADECRSRDQSAPPYCDRRREFALAFDFSHLLNSAQSHEQLMWVVTNHPYNRAQHLTELQYPNLAERLKHRLSQITEELESLSAMAMGIDNPELHQNLADMTHYGDVAVSRLNDLVLPY